MGAASAGAHSFMYAHMPRPGSNRPLVPPIPTLVQVTGYPPSTASEDLLVFLKRHAGRPLSYSNVDFTPTRLTLLLANRSQARSLSDLSGIRYQKEPVGRFVVVASFTVADSFASCALVS